MSEVVVKKPNKLGAKIWFSVVLFGLMGQLAWMVENVYFSTYIQKKITSDPWATSATVAASAVVAALVTIFGGVLSDRTGKRKVYVCWGYIIWGAVTAAFGLFDVADRTNVVLLVVIFVVMDCVMTIFGSMSNDAAFSSWVTDNTDITNRGFVEVILSIMPVAALMLIFVVFDPLTNSKNNLWWLFFLILGGMTAVSGLIGMFVMKDSPNLKPDKSGKYLQEVVYGFKPSNIKKHKMIYICLIGMMFSGLAMQLWQPQMIMLMQFTLGFGEDGFVIPLAAVVLLSAGLAVVGGKVMDKYGKDKFFYPVAVMGVLGGILVYIIKFTNCNPVWRYILFILGGTMIEGASLLAAGLFNATFRDYTPPEKAGCFQGIRIIIFVMLPMIIGAIVNPLVIKGLGPVVTEFDVSPAAGYIAIPKITDSYTNEIIGYDIGSNVYPFEMFLFSSLAAAFVFIPAIIVKKENNKFRMQKLQELHVIEATPEAPAADGNTEITLEQEETQAPAKEAAVGVDAVAEAPSTAAPEEKG